MQVEIGVVYLNAKLLKFGGVVHRITNNANFEQLENDEYSISVTIDSYTYETFDLLENTIQNGGWTETNENMYIIYLEPIDYNCIRFSKTNESTIEMEFVQSNVIETIFTLRNSN